MLFKVIQRDHFQGADRLSAATWPPCHGEKSRLMARETTPHSMVHSATGPRHLYHSPAKKLSVAGCTVRGGACKRHADGGVDAEARCRPPGSMECLLASSGTPVDHDRCIRAAMYGQVEVGRGAPRSDGSVSRRAQDSSGSLEVATRLGSHIPSPQQEGGEPLLSTRELRKTLA